MGSFIETIQLKKRLLPSMPYKDELPISSQSSKDRNLVGIRKRISSFSVNIQPPPASTASSTWAFRRSRPMPSLGDFARWWERSWGWLLSKKAAFTNDIETNGAETAILGRHSEGSLRHVFQKLRSEVRKLVRTDTTLPTSARLS